MFVWCVWVVGGGSGDGYRILAEVIYEVSMCGSACVAGRSVRGVVGRPGSGFGGGSWVIL